MGGLGAQGVSTTGWTLSVALSMTSDGRFVVGYGTNPSGQTQGWTATLYVPSGPACQTADFNWHRQSALALLRHSQFRRILLASLWS